jgi:uncharacterized membrane protein YfcA
MPKANPIRLTNPKFFIVFAFSWLVLLYLAHQPFNNLLDYWFFSFLGVVGAIFANSTGAGGGVIFIPMFAQLSFTEEQSIATSFAIQCFGMTAGAVTWSHHYYYQKRDLRLWQGFKRIIIVTSITATIGLTGVFVFQAPSPASLHISFSWFSLLLGFFIILTVFLIKAHRERSQIHILDYIVIILIGLFGGALTAWLSVGVGELLVIYLMLRRFDINMAIAAAVVVSAISVWSAIGHVHQNVYWQVLVFAGPGAVLGGIFAKTLVSHMSATRLKLFFSLWLLISGSAGIF